MNLLEIENLSVTYNGIYALNALNITLQQGEVVSVLGPNGAGKTTLLRAISGLVPPEPQSSIRFRNANLIGIPPHKIARQGIAHVPEGRQVFPGLTVHENLEIAGVRIAAQKRREYIEKAYKLFSELSERKDQLAGSLSGGEQQMLAIGRAIVSNCEMIMIDEPSMGLAPVIVSRIFKALKQIMESKNFTLLIVEQNAKLSLPLSDRIYVISQGQISLQGAVAELKDNEIIKDMYFAKQ
jgi:branched-chain amino acid transport system ATP-binding protein